ncbi:MAG TPA: Hsp20/alpha crystallin family protein [Syntrophomonas sp.]|nr:Hsp20/alpha crystallin family protein [Syntrophomonas sp.]
MRRDLSHWSPGKSMMPSEFLKGTFGNSFLEDFFNNSFMAGFSSTMRTDIREAQGSYILEIEMPGYSKEDIKVECVDGRITVSAQHMKQMEQENQNVIRQERHYGRVARSYSFEGIDEEMVRAEYKDGILRINIPQQQESTRRKKQIDIH